MLEKCPIIDNQKLFPCGAYFHGWLNATNPVPLDGTVNRTMCFSDITTCKCKKGMARKIQMRNCGSYFVYKLYNLIDVCSGNIAENARYCGMRGKLIAFKGVSISHALVPLLSVNVISTITPCFLKVDVHNVHHNVPRHHVGLLHGHGHFCMYMPNNINSNALASQYKYILFVPSIEKKQLDADL